MKILKQICIIFSLCMFGDLISKILPFPFPGSVIAMLLMFLCLMTKIIKVDQIEEVSTYLMSILPMLFVTTTVSIIQYFDILKEILWKFVFICILSGIITFAVTAYTVTFVIYLKERKK